ncbi:uncharacterized protein TRAVEDRAFT_18599 [Trametes versicolor FP-101664 SS1]|uniref:uncharacterized protein n=1 Tax=Trametes versicolor (strain FP-101664) TaxID=717944 RepID=UPI0004623E7A|nr:uncharacterized protein TRAVEDRAFT_18599 [Trametes versicolor FP-101664 SS1]EIW62122.1 hypothetical protein TRAVEDRAFT_18599 [Trametes versicolor FP-101664 SS1]
MTNPIMLTLRGYALASKQHNNLRDIQHIIEYWRAILGSLTDQQTANLEQQRPGVVNQMYQALICTGCHLMLLAHELESTSTRTLLWQRIWPRTQLSGERLMKATGETLAATLKATPNFDIVSAVLAADAAITELKAGESLVRHMYARATRANGAAKNIPGHCNKLLEDKPRLQAQKMRTSTKSSPTWS